MNSTTLVVGIYLGAARACYGSVLIAASLLAALCAYLLVVALFTHVYALVAAFALVPFVFIVAGAIRRKFCGLPLLPFPKDHGEWLIVFLMFFPAMTANFLVYCLGHAWYQYRFVHPDRDVEGGPMLFFTIVAALCYLVAMMLVEWGIKHEQRRSQALTSP